MWSSYQALFHYHLIERMKDIIKEITEHYVSDEELKNAKEYIVNSYVFRFTSTTQIVNRFITLEYYGLPTDYLETYLENIRRVTKEDILRVAKKYLRPEQTVVLVVGNKEKFEKSLNGFGKVNEIKPKGYQDLDIKLAIKDTTESVNRNQPFEAQ